MGKGPGGSSSRSILFIVRGDDTVPSCRFRAWQFREPLRRMGVEVGFVILERSRNPLRQALFHLKLICQLRRYRAVIFQKLLEPWRLAFLRLFNGNLHFDFDDAMYLAPDGAKFAATVRAAPHVIAGNALLASRARPYNASVAVVPTVVPVPPPSPSRPGGPRPAFVLSWIGSAVNLPFLDPMIGSLEAQAASGLSLRILTDKPEKAPRRPWIEVLKWSREAEEREFRECDVGLMPLEDTEWCAGKCACKALQYLSYGKPVITSPVGVNREMFADGAFGALVRTPEDWRMAVDRYRSDPALRERAGAAGRDFVARYYALEPWAAKLAALVVEGRRT